MSVADASPPRRDDCDMGEATETSVAEAFREVENAFGQIFSVKPPRDVLAGLWSGAKCVMSGMLLAIAGACMQPIEGLRESGVFGCFRGVGLGLATGLFFSITGFCTGIFQAVRGAIATPRAICMVSRGMRWNTETHEWGEPKLYSLPEEAAQVLAEGEDDDDEEAGVGGNAAKASSSTNTGTSRSPPRRRVVDTYYYDCLELPSSASQQEIRHAYFQQSRQWHPDKSSKPNAKEKFQAISEAYQVLSDPARRRTYDSQGKKDEGDNFIDAQVFFSVLFGADVLEPLIGRLRLADIFKAELYPDDEGDLDDADHSSNLAAHRQTRRQVKLAVSLAARLEPYVQGDCSSFRDGGRDEARSILQRDRSLEQFLSEIAFVYRNRAELYLARWQSRLGAFGYQALRVRVRGGGREARRKAATARLAVRSFMELRRIVNEADSKDTAEADASNDRTGAGSRVSGDGRSDARKDEQSSDADGDEDQLPKSLSSALPTFMETFWSLVAHDITGTLDRVIERVLSDSSVSLVDRRRRAEGLAELGDIFAQEAEAVHAEQGSATGSSEDERKRRRFEEAFAASLAGAGTGQAEAAR